MKKEEDNRYSIRADVVISEQFYGWIAGLGKQIQIVSPESVRQNYKEYLMDIIEGL